MRMNKGKPRDTVPTMTTAQRLAAFFINGSLSLNDNGLYTDYAMNVIRINLPLIENVAYVTNGQKVYFKQLFNNVRYPGRSKSEKLRERLTKPTTTPEIEKISKLNGIFIQYISNNEEQINAFFVNNGNAEFDIFPTLPDVTFVPVKITNSEWTEYTANKSTYTWSTVKTNNYDTNMTTLRNSFKCNVDILWEMTMTANAKM